MDGPYGRSADYSNHKTVVLVAGEIEREAEREAVREREREREANLELYKCTLKSCLS